MLRVWQSECRCACAHAVYEFGESSIFCRGSRHHLLGSRGPSSLGRARASHARGTGIETRGLHPTPRTCTLFVQTHLASAYLTPSAQSTHPHAWVQVSLKTIYFCVRHTVPRAILRACYEIQDVWAYLKEAKKRSHSRGGSRHT